MGEPHIGLRDSFLRTAIHAVDLGDARVTVEAAVAAMGAAAVFIAMLPEQSRESVIEQICEALPRHVEARSRELMSGEFDRHMERQQ